MNIQGSEAEIFLSEIKELIHKQFENLGNITGDFSFPWNYCTQHLTTTTNLYHK